MRRGLTTGLLLGGLLLGGCATDGGAQRAEGEKKKGRKVRVTLSQDPKAWEEWQKAQAAALEKARAERQAAAQRAAEARERSRLAQERAELTRAQRAHDERESELARQRAAEEAKRAADATAELQRREQELKAAEQAQLQTQQELERQRQELQERERLLAEERTARMQAEESARRALEQVASVREEARGLVATLSGSVLFATNAASLLPSAQRNLDRVAEAFRQTPNQNIIIEGHTDSVGAADYNADLSRRRAEAVRDYLVDRGVNGGQIRAVGLGEQRPVASNASPEGRANNRRVEIVLPRGTGGAGANDASQRPVDSPQPGESGSEE